MYKVFLVDDDELILQEIEKTIPWMDNGFEVVGKDNNPKHATYEIEKCNPDVVFCDLKMPIMDGHALMMQLREMNIESEFVMLSAYGTFEDARTFFHHEGFDYLLKPVQLEEVQLVLEKLATKLSKKHPVEQGTDTMNPAFLNLMDHVKNQYKEKITLDELGKQFGLSPGYVCNLFAKHYNTTLTCFITDIRMKKAVELMRGNYGSLKSIALECGYKDYYYFNKVFRDYYGMAPSQYNLENT